MLVCDVTDARVAGPSNPGWRWSEALWSIAGTGSRPARRSGYIQSGLAAHQNDDGYDESTSARGLLRAAIRTVAM
jgi:hypothetical protein